ncbi:MAG TPA: type II secretion system F family protein [Acetobacteraceae bacterium]|nr:type II secretion system F family protein [Acetobacteraceae bacterium]
MTMLTILLAMSVFFMIGLGTLAVAVAKGEADQRRFEARMARVSNVNAMRMDEPATPGLKELLARHVHQLDHVLSLFGIDLQRAPDYPLRWWLGLCIALLIARIITLMLAMLLGHSMLIALPPLMIFISRVLFGQFHSRRSKALFVQFPDALGTIVRCVKVGIPVQESLRIIARDMPAPTAQEFGRLADKVAIGVPLEQALQDLAGRIKLPEYRFFATALSLQARTGGALAQTLETLAEVIRKRVALRARGFALASEARTSAGILTALPVLSGVGIWALQPAYIATLFDSAGGKKLFVLAIGMLGIGVFAMRTLIKRSLS